jgi:hypothetical protein
VQRSIAFIPMAQFLGVPSMTRSAPQPSLNYVCGIVNLLQRDLDDLIRQKIDVRRRIRRLSRLLRDQSSPTPLAARGRATHAPRFRQISTKVGRPRARKSERQQFELTRACRIAFMDAGGIATPDQICFSIQRRGSFSFIDLDEKPIDLVIRILKFMAETGEAKCGSSDPQSPWAYTFKATGLE